MQFTYITAIFIFFYFSHTIWELVLQGLDIRYLKNHRDKIPLHLQGNIDQESLNKSIQYSLDGKKLSIISSLVTIPIDWFFIVFGFSILDSWVHSHQFHPNVQGLIFIGIYALIRMILGLPFSIYDDFVLEARYGFNKKTVKVFISDLVKGIILSILLGFPVLYAIFALMNGAGGFWWLWAFLIVSIFQSVVMVLYPVFIAPLFNKFTPVADDLKSAIQELTDRIDFKISGIFTMDGSKRSQHSNAYFTGFGKAKRIVFFDTLLEKITQGEMLAVLAHEMGHYKLGHIKKMLSMSLVIQFLFFGFLALAKEQTLLYPSFGFVHVSDYAAIIIFSMLFSEIFFPFQFLLTHLSRKHEFEADRFAMKSVGTNETLIGALIKLHHGNLSSPWVHPLYASYHYSHPELGERISASSS